MWFAEWGHQSAWLEQLAKETGSAPAALLNRPQIEPEWDYLKDAFLILSLSRQVGLGIGAIPLTEVRAYVQLFDVYHDVSLFARLIRLMDSAYMNAKGKSNGVNTSVRTG